MSHRCHHLLVSHSFSPSRARGSRRLRADGHGEPAQAAHRGRRGPEGGQGDRVGRRGCGHGGGGAPQEEAEEGLAAAAEEAAGERKKVGNSSIVFFAAEGRLRVATKRFYFTNVGIIKLSRALQVRCRWGRKGFMHLYATRKSFFRSLAARSKSNSVQQK